MDEFNYYNNYLLDSKMTYELSKHDLNLLDASIWLVENKSSIRKTALDWGYSKSVLHRLLHSNLKSLSFELYSLVLKQISYNKKNTSKGYRKTRKGFVKVY